MEPFLRYISVGYSGAETPNDSLNGFWVYLAAPALHSIELRPHASRTGMNTEAYIVADCTALAMLRSGRVPDRISMLCPFQIERSLK